MGTWPIGLSEVSACEDDSDVMVDEDMRYDPRFLDELKGRLRLSDVIGRSVKLRRQGREWVGLSPFGKEKSPSFFVNDEKGFFHDFSSGKHGDLIGFLRETERLSFREAVERLAAEAGLSLPVPDPRAAEQEARRQGLSDWMVEAQAWFSAQLRRPPGEAARRYLDRRALPQAQWERFGLGYAPAGRTGLKDHLIAKGARPAELVEAGLLLAPDDGAAPYDRFRDRIVLRDQGAAALREQLGAVTPFVQLLFEREREAAAPLSTPESYAGLKVSLRKLAGAIADRDLAQMYREALLDRFEELRTLSRPAATLSGAGRAMAEACWIQKPQGRGGGSRLAQPLRNDITPQVVAAQSRSARAPSNLSAALVEGVLRHPELIDDRFETLDAYGFADAGLQDLARALIALRLEGGDLQPRDLRGALSERGFGDQLQAIGWAAARSGAAFLDLSTPAEEARGLWLQAYALQLRLSVVNEALRAARRELRPNAEQGGFSFAAHAKLKAERDLLEQGAASGSYAMEHASA